MKKKLFCIFTAVFVAANILSLAAMQPAYADPNTDAIKVIGECKSKTGPHEIGSTCDLYNKCIKRVMDTAICPNLKTLNPVVPGITVPTLQGCLGKKHEAKECYDAYATCVNNRLEENKLSGEDAKACVDAIAKGDLAAATDPVADDKDNSSCVIDGIGWILCPVLTFIAFIVDSSYVVVSNLLTVQPLFTSGEGSEGVYQAWSIMRNFANVAFVIAFMIIIFSQVSSIGISNYGIKRMLPRLIVAAVLVNISFWICAIAIDISNILGSSLGGLFGNIENSVRADSGGTFSGSGTWANLTGGILASAAAIAIVYVSLSALVPALVTVLLTIVVTFIVLTLRQALIILLVVIAPLAFVAYLLPNTESLFSKWRGLFQILLLMYPIIAVIFGASALASTIVMHSAPDDAAMKIPIQIMGGMISIIPLVITPIIMKTAGGMLNRFAGIVNDKGKGLHDRGRKAAEGWGDDFDKKRRRDRINRGKGLLGGNGVVLGRTDSRRRKAAAFAGSFGLSRTIPRDKQREFNSALADEAATQYFSERVTRDDKFASKMARGDERVAAGLKASAQAATKKIFDNDVHNVEVLYRTDPKFVNNPEAALKKAIEKGDAIGAVAAQNILMTSGAGGVSKFRKVIEDAETSENPAMQQSMAGLAGALKSNISENHGQYAKQKGADVLKWAKTDGTQLHETNFNAEELNPAELAGQHAGTLLKMAQNGQITEEQAKKVLDDQRIAGQNMDEKKQAVLENVAGRSPETARIDDIHEQANQLNIKHDQDAAYQTYEDNIRH